jgi:2-polyprenyl-3-methyl-5-hydroxy-6-metoxy-1,4-benzoquinol methylase
MKPTKIEVIHRVWFGEESLDVNLHQTQKHGSQERAYSGIDEEVWLGMYHLGYGCWTRPARPVRVLDAGCGSGYGADFLKQVLPTDEVVAIDYAADAARFAMLRAPDARVLQHDLACVGELPGTFDAIFAIESVEHVQDDMRMFVGFYEKLNPGGMLFVSTPDKTLFDAAYAAAHPEAPERALNPFHVREYTESELRAILESWGFEHVTRVRAVLPYHEALAMVCWKPKGP